MELRLKPYETYLIVSDNGCTISYIDAAGVSHVQSSVPAHEEKRFTCLSPRTEVSDDAALVLPLPGTAAADTGEIQEQVTSALCAAQEPAELTEGAVLMNGKVYTYELAGAVSFEGLSVAGACTTSELWLTTGDEVPTIAWPSDWQWIENDDPSRPTAPAPNALNCYVVRRDSVGVIINLAYHH